MVRVTPDTITSLKHNEIFVFGSNMAGRHGKGAALTAVKKFGAIYGNPSGLQHQCYAIPTLDEHFQKLPLMIINQFVKTFITFAQDHSEYTFLVTPIGCGLAGFKPSTIAPLFRDCLPLEQVYLPQVFLDIFI
jgi:hypothetical protein